MARVARIWVLGPGVDPAGARLPEASDGARGPRSAPLEDGPAGTPGEGPLARWLDGLAARHADGEVVVVGDAELPAACAALALGVPRGAIRAASATLDWPAGECGPGPGERAAPLLVGLDLDWVPPLGTGRARFPGGPGVAGSARG